MATRPIEYWMFHFPGRDSVEGGDAYLDNFITKSDYAIRNKKQLDMLSEESEETDLALIVKEKKPDVVKLSPVSSRVNNAPIVRNNNGVHFNFNGYETTIDLGSRKGSRPPALRTDSEGNRTLDSSPVQGSTENISIRATIRTKTNFGRGELAFGVEPDDTAVAKRISRIPRQENQPADQATDQPGDETLATIHSEIPINDFPVVQPILYLEQGNEAYILLAELSQPDGKRRILFTIKSNDGKGSRNRRRSIPGNQIVAITPPFMIENGLEYTIRVHQDGDVDRQKSYFEFWIENIPLGYFYLTNTQFPFKQGETKVCIGYWPRKGKSPEKERRDLFFQGDILDLIFDPNDLCPGCK